MGKLTRRELLKYIGAGSALNFVPNFSGISLGADTNEQQSGAKPKLRAVIRMQMYAGWDVALSCDPPLPKYHVEKSGSMEEYLVNFNFPSAMRMPRIGSQIGDGKSGDLSFVNSFKNAFNSIFRVDFLNNPERAMRMLKNSLFPPDTVNPLSRQYAMSDFTCVSGAVGASGTPFAEIPDSQEAANKWTRVHPANPSIHVGPLMHQFTEFIPETNASGSAPSTKRYLDHMTIINGIDSNNNVFHPRGSIIAATGYDPTSIGNTESVDLGSNYGASIEAIMADELTGKPDTFAMVNGVMPYAFVPVVTFKNGANGVDQRNYAATSPKTPTAALYETVSLIDLNNKTSFNIPQNLRLGDTIPRLKEQAKASKISARSFDALTEFYKNSGSLGLTEFDPEEVQAFGSMIELVYNKNATFVGEGTVPKIQLRHKDTMAPIANWRTANASDLRLDLNPARQGTWQGHLATAAKLVKKGYTRGISITLGGRLGNNPFLPDTHTHNDHVQMMYQGQFWDGVKRMINYLTWTKDDDGKPLLDTTLLIVTADIIRGPSYQDVGIAGKSDFRNNSCILIGGNLNHSTLADDGVTKLPGRIIGNSHGGYESCRIDFATGKELERTKNSQVNVDKKIKFENIYASLLKCYGMNHQKHFKDKPVIGPIAENKSGLKKS
jgi:hypothetical protein